MQALICTTSTITLLNTPCFVAVEIYVRDAAESLSCWYVIKCTYKTLFADNTCWYWLKTLSMHGLGLISLGYSERKLKHVFLRVDNKDHSPPCAFCLLPSCLFVFLESQRKQVELSQKSFLKISLNVREKNEKIESNFEFSYILCNFENADKETKAISIILVCRPIK